MKNRMNIMLGAILVMLGAIILLLARGQEKAVVAVSAPPAVSDAPALRIQVETAPPPSVQPALAASVESAPASPASAQQSGDKPAYVAVDGDTLSNVAAGLFGSDSKKNRDAAVAANPSLQEDPDRVMAGKTYFHTAPDAVSAAPTSPEPQFASIPTTQAEAALPNSDRILKYTAQAGDSVSALAAGLLGGNSKTNRDAIINENRSLQNDPDRVIAGKTYKIPGDNGLSAAPEPVNAIAPRPTSQPDADDVIKMSSGRELRYTALAGDNVSKLAKVLLGSDTQANRDAIISNNPSLKSDPDRVVVGQMYWIPAPVAVLEPD